MILPDQVFHPAKGFRFDLQEGGQVFLRRVPQKYLASYLNIKPETFSRLKHLGRKPQKINGSAKRS